MDAGFHNPYNFVPALPRDRARGTELGDSQPRPHGRYHPCLWTGRLDVRMTTVTPLLLLDHAERLGGDREHRTYPVRLLGPDRPHVASTAVKGMLRAAYEAVTNSRFGVLTSAGERFGYRRETKSALGLKPVRIENDLIRVLESARLPRYEREASADGKSRKVEPLRYLDTRALPGDGEEAWAVVQQGTVRAIVRRDVARLRNVPGTVVHGWAHVTGRNIAGKAYERFFFSRGGGDQVMRLDENPKLVKRWQELMKNAMEANSTASERVEPDRPELSLHLREDEGAGIREFRQPRLAYAQLRGSRIEALYPVLVSRDLYEKRPVDFLHPSLQPARSLKELSPADRVFGWSAEGKTGAHRGQLRIGPVEPGPGSVPVTITGGLPLTILSDPKPQQARFYLGQQHETEGSVPQPSGAPQQDVGYGDGRWPKALRGRKVYPHQRDLERVDWSRPTAEAREHAATERSDQNMTVEGWVAPGARLTFSIEVTNLTDVELGALVWLLDQESLCFKLGAGKPLGFGSVRLELVGTSLARGEDLVERYRGFGDVAAPPPPDRAVLREAFETALNAAYLKPPAELPFIASFLAAGKGLEGPVHYPRLARQRDAEGVNFRWFTENEREGGPKVSLPSLTEDRRLPYFPNASKPGDDANGRERRGPGRRPHGHRGRER